MADIIAFPVPKLPTESTGNTHREMLMNIWKGDGWSVDWFLARLWADGFKIVTGKQTERS